ncbi:glutaminase liver isoform, mitochondrial isoform X2 [Lemur catta]|uniref:glutaminase liver isoform, mitochondrial isoform X2 n=1 Tax=Lemur catta TaxID=9447 RepID=UPI001E26CA16|nr:glutaminase liver isoform, mitochondrial isoform X2 [Lemur catta]
MRSMKALQKALSRAGNDCRRGVWGHLSRSPLFGGGVRYLLSEAAAPGRETPHGHQPQHQGQFGALGPPRSGGDVRWPGRAFGQVGPRDVACPSDSSESGMLSRLGDLLFYTIAEGQERIPIHKFTTALKATGLQTTDPRLQDCMSQMHRMVQESSNGGLLDRDLFQKCVSSNIVLLTQAFRKKFVIPDFEEFTGHVDRIFEDAKELTGGKVAAYIPQLAKSNPDLWGVSLCTVDGQRHSVGHTKIPFCLQSCVKPLTYAISISTLGTDYVHKFVGKEPSGLRYNKLSLNEEGIPHNPMVNAGAIVVSSLIKMDCNKAEKFDFVLQYLNKMAGNEYVGFSNATFQSEKETGDRNYAIGYYLKEKKCFPKGVDMMAALDLYFQLCSVEVTCESGSVMAATLANGGICPITGESVLSAEAVRNTLSLMHSCGMYDFSGQFAFHVGLPAKSAVSGAILLVVPNVMGMMCLSPPLDKLGNSQRGINFCQKLVSLFNFHNYDNLRHCARKLDPRREGGEVQNKTVVNLLFAAYSGDVSALRRFALSAMNMEQKDYDSRTALHVAAAEGHTEVVKFLIEACKVNPFVKDRWGNIPLDDAVQFNHLEVVKLLQDYQDSYTLSETQAEAAAEALSKENLESMV